MNNKKALDGIMSFAKCLANGTFMSKEFLERERFNEVHNVFTLSVLPQGNFNSLIIDTCSAFDTNKWETGISEVGTSKWTIVEEYNNKKEAYYGHLKYVNLVKSGQTKFADIDPWGLDEDEEA